MILGDGIKAAMERRDADDVSPGITFSHGLFFAMTVVDRLIAKSAGTIDLSVSGWSSDAGTGLFLSDEINDRRARIGPNAGAGCGRIYVGGHRDFSFPWREPDERLVCGNLFLDFEENEIDGVADLLLEYFGNGNFPTLQDKSVYNGEIKNRPRAPK